AGQSFALAATPRVAGDNGLPRRVRRRRQGRLVLCLLDSGGAVRQAGLREGIGGRGGEHRKEPPSCRGAGGTVSRSPRGGLHDARVPGGSWSRGRDATLPLAFAVPLPLELELRATPADSSRGRPPSSGTRHAAHLVFLSSSMAEHPAVNRRVAGSSPA